MVGILLSSSKIPQMNWCSLLGQIFSSQRGLYYILKKGKMEVRDEDKIMRIKSNKYIEDLGK